MRDRNLPWVAWGSSRAGKRAETVVTRAWVVGGAVRCDGEHTNTEIQRIPRLVVHNGLQYGVDSADVTDTQARDVS